MTQTDTDQLAEILARRHRTELDADADAAIVDVETPTTQLVLFAVGDSLFAFPGTSILEILPWARIYPIPGCPPSLEGVLHLRGEIVSVVRLGDLLDRGHAEPDRKTAILLGQGAGLRSGLHVDRVLDVLELASTGIQPPPTTLAESLRRLATGVFHYRDQPVILLDLDRLFTDYLRDPS
ncbi:chemotaxis protein CheW [Thioalkalicoccus limnaeus]|uniref:Chemotaxis protein CheW n=1 Tax=Thioalkalicoccus limnaeus TaxID=120681 RepID=A0ABV4BHD3_9GAMM